MNTPHATPYLAFGGWMMLAALALSILYESTGITNLAIAAGCFASLGIAAFAPGLPRSRQVFILIALVLLALLVATRTDWLSTTQSALQKAGFIAAFFTAMASMRMAAMGSTAILDCGRFLASQPPGKRYLALTVGGHLFGLLLMYGAITLLGTLATEAAAREPDEEIRRHRVRRMLVAIQRGFISTLPWSPLAFGPALTLAMVPGSDWGQAAPYCLLSALLLAGIGWGLDTVFKPRLSTPPPPRRDPQGRWLEQLRPLLLLLTVLLVTVASLHLLSGLRIIAAVMMLVPLIALLWMAFQSPLSPGTANPHHALRCIGAFARRELPNQRSELVLLVMATVIGTLGAALATPLITASGWDIRQLPTPVILLALFWVTPLGGQLGMNPLLSVALLAPLLPTPAELGVSPAVVVTALTSGWALTGATSPFTASTALVGAYGQVPARRVGQVWNGPYALVCGAVLSLWVMMLPRLVP